MYYSSRSGYYRIIVALCLVESRILDRMTVIEYIGTDYRIDAILLSYAYCRTSTNV